MSDSHPGPRDSADGDVPRDDAPRRGRAAVAALVSRRLPDGSTFLRGLSIGALVGAAIAGSAIRDRRRIRRREAARVPVLAPVPPAGADPGPAPERPPGG